MGDVESRGGNSPGAGAGAGTGVVPGGRSEGGAEGVRRQKTHLYNLVT